MRAFHGIHIVVMRAEKNWRTQEVTLNDYVRFESDESVCVQSSIHNDTK